MAFNGRPMFFVCCCLILLDTLLLCYCLFKLVIYGFIMIKALKLSLSVCLAAHT